MENQADIILRDDQFYVLGELNFSNVMSVLKKSIGLFAASPSLVIHFAELKSSDSSGLALVMEWIQYAQNHHKTLQYCDFPAYLYSIAKAAGVDKLILQVV